MLVVGYLFITIVPIIIVAGVSIWGISYVVRKIKSWKDNFKEERSKNDIEIVNMKSEDYPDGEIIDVDYREVK